MDYSPSMMNVVHLVLTTPLFETPPIPVLSHTQSTCTFTMYTSLEHSILLTHSFLVDHKRQIYMCKHPQLNQLLYLGSSTTLIREHTSTTRERERKRERERDYMMDTANTWIELDVSSSVQLFLHAGHASSAALPPTKFTFLWQSFTLDDVLMVCSRELLNEQERTQHHWDMIWTQLRQLAIDPMAEENVDEEDERSPLPAP